MSCHVGTLSYYVSNCDFIRQYSFACHYFSLYDSKHAILESESQNFTASIKNWSLALMRCLGRDVFMFYLVCIVCSNMRLLWAYGAS